MPVHHLCMHMFTCVYVYVVPIIVVTFFFCRCVLHSVVHLVLMCEMWATCLCAFNKQNMNYKLY